MDRSSELYILPAATGDETFLPRALTFQCTEDEMHIVEALLRQQHADVIYNQVKNQHHKLAENAPYYFYQVSCANFKIIKPPNNIKSYLEFKKHLCNIIQSIIEQPANKPVIVFGEINYSNLHHLPYFIHYNEEYKRISIITIDPAASIWDGDDPKDENLKTYQLAFNDIFSDLDENITIDYYDPNITLQLRDYDCGFHTFAIIDLALTTAREQNPELRLLNINPKNGQLILRKELLKKDHSKPKLYGGRYYYPTSIASQSTQTRLHWIGKIRNFIEQQQGKISRFCFESEDRVNIHSEEETSEPVEYSYYRNADWQDIELFIEYEPALLDAMKKETNINNVLLALTSQLVHDNQSQRYYFRPTEHYINKLAEFVYRHIQRHPNLFSALSIYELHEAKLFVQTILERYQREQTTQLLAHEFKLYYSAVFKGEIIVDDAVIAFIEQPELELMLLPFSITEQEQLIITLREVSQKTGDHHELEEVYIPPSQHHVSSQITLVPEPPNWLIQICYNLAKMPCTKQSIQQLIQHYRNTLSTTVFNQHILLAELAGQNGELQRICEKVINNAIVNQEPYQHHTYSTKLSKIQGKARLTEEDWQTLIDWDITKKPQVRIRTIQLIFQLYLGELLIAPFAQGSCIPLLRKRDNNIKWANIDLTKQKNSNFRRALEQISKQKERDSVLTINDCDIFINHVFNPFWKDACEKAQPILSKIFGISTKQQTEPTLSPIYTAKHAERREYLRMTLARLVLRTLQDNNDNRFLSAYHIIMPNVFSEHLAPQRIRDEQNNPLLTIDCIPLHRFVFIPGYAFDIDWLVPQDHNTFINPYTNQAIDKKNMGMILKQHDDLSKNLKTLHLTDQTAFI